MQEAVSHRRILLVEDDTELREALGDALRERNHEVIAVEDGIEALREARGRRPDVVVLDLMMPAMDGWEFRVEQRRDPALADIPVVAISANRGPVAAAIDADLYVPKPLDAETLLGAIELVIENKQRTSAKAELAEDERIGAIRTMAAGVAHEVNNPLTYVLLHLTQALRLIPEISTERNRQTTDKIEAMVRGAVEGVHRIRDITAGIGSFARTGPQSRAFLDVRPVLDASLQLLLPDLRKRARVLRSYGPVPPTLASESSLSQVFFHVLANAVQSMPPGAPDENELHVTTRTGEHGDTVVEVSDTGVGIPEHVRRRIFEPFFTTRPQGEGVGLGLSIAFGVVRQHGGDIAVESEPGRGTTVRIRLPAARDHEPESGPPSA